MRAALGVAEDELLQLQPTRAIERKGLPDAVSLADGLDATLWITGPVEEGYDDSFRALVARARGRVIHRWPPGAWTMDDAYAACDYVSFPSHVEGFGLPMIEGAQHAKLLVARTYPVARDFARAGLRWIDVDSPSCVDDTRSFLNLTAPERADWLAHNQQVAAEWFSTDAARARLAAVLDSLIGGPG